MLKFMLGRVRFTCRVLVLWLPFRLAEKLNGLPGQFLVKAILEFF
jgi:hypothetical protein